MSYESGHGTWANNLQVGDEVIRITSRGGFRPIATGEVCRVVRLTKTIIEVAVHGERGTWIEQYKRAGYGLGSLRSGAGSARLVPHTDRNVAEMAAQNAAQADRDARNAATRTIDNFYARRNDEDACPTAVLVEIAQVIESHQAVKEAS